MKVLRFSGDRRSKTIAWGRRLKKVFSKRISVMLWDGHSSHIYITEIKIGGKVS